MFHSPLPLILLCIYHFPSTRITLIFWIFNQTHPTQHTITVDDSASQVKKEQEEPQMTNTPVTPSKRGRKKPDPNDTDDNEDASPTKKAKSPGKRSGVMGPIPLTYEEAGPADRTMLHMRETESKPWAEIQKVLEEMTRAKLGGSTLQNRYARIKVNFVVFNKEDEPRLVEAKREIEEKMEQEKWQRIADAIEAKGGNRYPSSAVQKKFKEMVRKNGVAGSVEE